MPNKTKTCPACQQDMNETVTNSGAYKCSKCKGVFIPASLIGIHE